jgi:hypothetical protein
MALRPQAASKRSSQLGANPLDQVAHADGRGDFVPLELDLERLLHSQADRFEELSPECLPCLDDLVPGFWPDVGLGLTLWKGMFEGHTDTWLRWCDENGQAIPTGEERALKAEARVRELEEALRCRNGTSGKEPPAS